MFPFAAVHWIAPHVSNRLKAISDVLGHSSLESTSIYAKVAVDDLRQVALAAGEELP